MADQIIHQSSFHFIFLTLAICLGSFYFGYNLGALNFPLDYIVYKLQPAEKDLFKSFSGACLAIGAAIGSMSTGMVLNHFSRNKSMMVTDLIGIIGCCLCFIEVDVIFIIGRLVIGLAVGLNSALVPTILNEWIPASLKNILLNVNSILINGGIVIANIIAHTYAITPSTEFDTIPAHEWQLVVCMAPLLACAVRTILLVFVFTSETPLYLISNKQQDKAQELLESLYEEHSATAVFEEVKGIADRANESGVQQTYSDMFTPKYKGRMMIGITLQFIQQFSGINAVIFFSGNIFQTVTHKNLPEVFTLTILVGVTLTSTSLIAGLVMKFMGRKQLLVLGDIVCIASLGGLTILKFANLKGDDDTLNIISIICIFIYLFGFGVSLGPLVWLYNSEILPAKGVALATLANWTGVIFITFTFPLVVNNEGDRIEYMFMFFAICCTLGLFYIMKFVKETKNLRPDQIEKTFLGDDRVTDSYGDSSKE